MPSAIESSVSGFQAAFAMHYGSIPGNLPSWLQALLSALESALPAILAGCGVSPAATSILVAVTEMPLSTTIKLMGVCRDAGVPLRDRRAAATALSKTIAATSEADLVNLLAFAQAS